MAATPGMKAGRSVAEAFARYIHASESCDGASRRTAEPDRGEVEQFVSKNAGEFHRILLAECNRERSGVGTDRPSAHPRAGRLRSCRLLKQARFVNGYGEALL